MHLNKKPAQVLPTVGHWVTDGITHYMLKTEPNRYTTYACLH